VRDQACTKNRYHLVQLAEAWLIRDVVLACLWCGGQFGNTSCPACHGEGWLSESEPKTLPKPPKYKRF
jgi:hypothetical protein